jgi:integrase/recombinase XerD|tara:strand:- start:107 stop:682 length:576 start_codon:yes stop_codon:yes gene_type:complete
MKQAKVLTKEEIRKVLKVCQLTKHEDRNRFIVLLSFWSGMRAIEIANLRVNNVVSADNEVLDDIALDKTQTKGNKGQTIYIGKALKKEIALYLSKFPNLLNNKEGNLIKTQKGKTTSGTIQYIFKQLYALANIPNATSHSGRRSFITELSEKGVSVRVIQELARHSSLQTTQRYIDVSVPKLKNAVDLIGV